MYNYGDSLFEATKHLTIRNNITMGSRIDLRVGTGYNASLISMEEGYDINILAPFSSTSTSVINLQSKKAINLDAPKVNLSNDLFVLGSITSLNIGVKSPMYFTTNRTTTIAGNTYSVYDIDLTRYTKSILLDGYNIRQFRVRHWPADADFEYSSTYYSELNIKRYDISMSNKNGLSIFSLSSPLENYYLRELFRSHFLYRNSFNYMTYCVLGSTPTKVYFIIEDLL